METVLMRSNLQVQQPQTSMKVLDCRLVQGLELLSFPIIIRRHRVSRTSKYSHYCALLAIGASKQELLLAGGIFNALFHILFLCPTLHKC